MSTVMCYAPVCALCTVRSLLTCKVHGVIYAFQVYIVNISQAILFDCFCCGKTVDSNFVVGGLEVWLQGKGEKSSQHVINKKGVLKCAVSKRKNKVHIYYDT